MQAGLDSAIVSANKILPLAKIPEQQQKVCLDLIYDRRVFENDICVYDPLTELTKLFENPSEILNQESKKLDLTIEERLKNHIIDGERQGLEATLSQALEKYPPLEIINVYLLDGMKTVGELFGSGQMQLPFVLQSAQTMKAAVAHLEPFMEKNVNSNGKGTLLIATVKGDVHDIGKNLVDIILSNNGYQVINLGIKQPVENIIKAYEESNADCIAMSGLLVKSTAFMKENLEAFNEKGITVPVILGGAALNSKFVDQDCQNTYKGRVIYGKDAFTDLKFMDRLMPAKQDNRWNNLVGFLDEEQDQTTNQKNIAPITIESKFFPQVEEDEVIEPAIERNIDRPHPPFWGTRILNKNDIALSDLFPLLDIQALYVGQWQFRKTKEQSESDYKSFLQNTVEPILQTWQEKAQKEQILDPTVVYGYFPCNAEGDTLYIYDSKTLDQSNPIASFTFPRQKKGRRLCIADFFAERSSGIIDVFPMQAVTVGDVATEYAKQLFEADEYSNYLYYHGMAVQTAEALAEWTHRLIRQELGIEKDLSLSIKDLLRQRYQGSRYSFGYPACPNIQDQYRQIELLDCQRIGLYMDESEQIYPEQSTTALIVYHPSAKYFNI
jgi:5-methyltetrahydrofolate--homocysteine methyltransferase